MKNRTFFCTWELFKRNLYIVRRVLQVLVADTVFVKAISAVRLTVAIY